MILAISSVILIHFISAFFPYFWFAKFAGPGKWFFLAPVVVLIPVYLMRVVTPFLVSDENLFQYIILALSVEIIYSIIQIILLILLTVKLKKYLYRLTLPFSFNHVNEKVFNKNLNKAAWFFLLIGCTSLLILANISEIGISGWLTNPRYGYQFYRSGQGHWWILSQFTIGISLFLFTFYEKNKIKTIVIFFLFLTITYFLGSKQLLINEIVYLFGLWGYRHKLNLKFLTIVSIPITLLLIFLFFGSITEISSDAKELFIGYFDYYINGAQYYKEYYSGNIQLYYGSVYFGNWWSLVPRIVWPDKPVVYGELQITEYFFPGAVEATHSPAFFGRVTEFADFGFPGLFIFAIFDISFWFFIIFSIVACKLLSKGSIENGVQGFVFLYLFTPNLWSYVRGVNALIVAILIFFILNLFFRRRSLFSIVFHSSNAKKSVGV